MTEEVQPVAIEADAETLIELRGKLDALGSDQAAAYAMSLGLFPPAYHEGAPESIVEYWGPGDDADNPGTLVWGSTFPVDEDGNDEDEDGGSDPWENAGPPTPPADSNEDTSGPDPWAGF
jgi:hypothetical protein